MKSIIVESGFEGINTLGILPFNINSLVSEDCTEFLFVVSPSVPPYRYRLENGQWAGEPLVELEPIPHIPRPFLYDSYYDSSGNLQLGSLSDLIPWGNPLWGMNPDAEYTRWDPYHNPRYKIKYRDFLIWLDDADIIVEKDSTVLLDLYRSSGPPGVVIDGVLYIQNLAIDLTTLEPRPGRIDLFPMEGFFRDEVGYFMDSPVIPFYKVGDSDFYIQPFGFIVYYFPKERMIQLSDVNFKLRDRRWYNIPGTLSGIDFYLRPLVLGDDPIDVTGPNFFFLARRVGSPGPKLPSVRLTSFLDILRTDDRTSIFPEWGYEAVDGKHRIDLEVGLLSPEYSGIWTIRSAYDGTSWIREASLVSEKLPWLDWYLCRRDSSILEFDTTPDETLSVTVLEQGAWDYLWETKTLLPYGTILVAYLESGRLEINNYVIEDIGRELLLVFFDPTLDGIVIVRNNVIHIPKGDNFFWPLEVTLKGYNALYYRIYQIPHGTGLIQMTL